MSANIYYNPEKFGLQTVTEIDYSSGNYEFDLRVIWINPQTGKYYTARDSGCSCPSPFEDYHKIEDLEEYSFDTIRSEALAVSRRRSYNGDSASDFIDKLPR